VTYTLGRCEDKSHEKHIIELLENEDMTVRMRAVEALGRMRSKKSIEPLFAIAKGEDRMMALKAAEALVRIGDKRCARALVELLSSQDTYMLTIALGGLESIAEGDSYDSVVPLLDSKSLMVRLAALKAAGATGRDKARERLLAVYRSGLPIEKMTALEALSLAKNEEDLPLLVSALSGGDDPLVREGAAMALGTWHKEKHLYEEDEDGRRPIDALFDAVTGDDWVVASIAAESIGKIGERETIDDLVRLYPKSSERFEGDRKLAVLNAIIAIGERKTVKEESVPPLLEFLNEASRDPDPRIGQAAALAAQEFKGSLKAQPSGPWPRGDLPWGEPALPMGERRIRIVTGRGNIDIALYGDDAPSMVKSIITLAKNGFYKDLTFHRVVPGFVIQGGCPRGDGWGDAGYFLRSQFNLHRYERGIVGMAHAGKDTPGSQFFITHTPQPHLNGRYTVIGKVTSGMEVVDKIERGDTFDIVIVK
jgi:peptidyl-prolyl cis-trans isomerase B (cyclophilin B)